MKFLLLLSFLVSSLFPFALLAGEGDTLVVQTINWDTPVLPGWNSPRSGVYQFPDKSLSFSKILMYYTLKCDPGQNPACGEWDYTTHTTIQEHTGILDSNLYFHPNYLVNNSSPDSFMYMNDVSFYYIPSLQYSNQTIPTNEVTIGSGGYNLELTQGNNRSDGKMQFIYQATELISAGLHEGEITGLKLDCFTDFLSFSHFQIGMQNTLLDNIKTDSMIKAGFTKVFEQNIHFGNGSNTLYFSFPFQWDGVSNILIEYSYADLKGSGFLAADSVAPRYTNQSLLADTYLDFEGWDYLTVPADVFNTVDSAITISFWQYGNPDIQPINSSVFEGTDENGNRILNAHLPWSNGRIYWDAGWDEGNDRIDRGTSDAGIYEGKWNFWTFTKDVRDGMMKIYLNGQLWFQGSVKYKPMGGIKNFRIGAGITYEGYYAGMIDEIRIWDTVIGWDEIKEWMYKRIKNTHPQYDHLRAYYRLDEGNGLTAEDKSPHGFDAEQFGYPEWKNYRGKDRFKNGVSINRRPHIALQNGDYNPALLDSVVVVDTFSHAPVNIVLFDPEDPPSPTDTLFKYPAYYHNYIYNDNAEAIDSVLVSPDGILYREDMPYYGEPYELVVPWEIGRFITPYGIGLNLGDGFTWVYDVTDYEPFLRDSVHITAGNFQELLDLKFYMIEGTPPREVKKIEKVVSGYFNLDNFVDAVPPVSVALAEETSTYRIKTRTSGHLFDNATNCAEFCSKIHDVTVNGTKVFEWEILQECSDNPLYPQGGTWIYDRAGWCPGDKVMEHDIEITPYINGDTAVIDYNSQTDPYGAYSLEMQLFSYGEPNFNLDAAVDEVFAPNNLKRYTRFNPTCSSPIIVIQNMGKDTLRSLHIEYGPSGHNKVFEWEGNLAFMDKEMVKLEAFNMEQWSAGNGVFHVNVSSPNDEPDENQINNSFQTKYTLPDILPSTIVIQFKTNLTPEQNAYEIRSANGELIYEKNDFEPLTTYSDTITFLNGGYDFYLFDSGDNGISFWADNEGNGTIRFYNLDGDIIKSFNGDFGDQIYYSFFTDLYLGGESEQDATLNFEIYPNPSSGIFSLSYSMEQPDLLSVKIINTSAQVVYEDKIEKARNGKLNFNLNHLPSGIYTAIMEYGDITRQKRIILNN